MKVVVAGGGSVGRFTAEQLVSAGHEVTIIENDRSVVAEYAENESSGKLKWHRGDACDVAVLAAAGVTMADVVASVTGDDEDNLVVSIDTVIYFQVTDPMRASYGSSNYIVAISQLAQTSLRSVIGKLELDKTFEERDIINAQVVAAIDEAALNWGVKVLRYEIKDLTPPKEILHSMQAQITAEREKRALIAASEGRRQEQINIATGEREAFIARSEGEKQAAINKALGEAAAISSVATATAEAIEAIASAIQKPGGEQAVQLRVAEKAVEAYSKVASESNTTLVIPSDLGQVATLIGTAMKVVQTQK